MKLLLLIMSLLFILLLAGLWVGSGSYPERWRIQERSSTQELANTKRKEQINEIKAELDDVNSGSAAIEERARSELGMTGKGETFYEVILQSENKEKKPITIKNNKATDNHNTMQDNSIENKDPNE